MEAHHTANNGVGQPPPAVIFLVLGLRLTRRDREGAGSWFLPPHPAQPAPGRPHPVTVHTVKLG